MRTIFKPRCMVRMGAVFDGRGAADSTPLLLEVEPRAMTTGINGLHEADTFSLDIDGKLLPFDPEQIAACAVDIFLWDDVVSGQQTDWAVDGNKMIEGLTDDIKCVLVGDDNVIQLTGRDYTSVLHDKEWDTKNSVPVGKPLDLTIQEIADDAAPANTRARFQVVWKVDANIPLCGGIHRSAKGKGLWIKSGKSYWDVIYELAIDHGFVARIRGQQLIITDPQTETSESLAQSPRLVYGKHLSKLEMGRKFGRKKVPQLVMRGHDPATNKFFELVYPPERNKVVDGLAVLKDDREYVPAPKGVVDQKALLRYLKARFYHSGRGETTYSFSTSNLYIDDPKGGEINLMNLRDGAAIGVSFDPFNQNFLRTMNEEGKRTEYIISLGYKPKVAAFIAANFERMGTFNQDYYYNTGTISYDAADGVELDFEAINFAYEVREVHFAESAAQSTTTEIA